MVQLRTLLVATAFLALGQVAQAGREEEVNAARRIMDDLPEELVKGFCVERVGYTGSQCGTTGQESAAVSWSSGVPARVSGTGTLRSISAGVLATISTSAWPTTSSPSFAAPTLLLEISTVTRTTTITVTMTSTIFVPATAPPTIPTKRVEERFMPYNRATWCSDYDVPCRLVQYEGWVVDRACEMFLGSGEGREEEGECKEGRNKDGSEEKHDRESEEDDLEEAVVEEAMEDWKHGAE